MAKGTKVEWADDTVNAEMGCDGCELWDPKNQVRICYAGLQTERMLSKGPLKGWPPTFDQPSIFPGRIAAAARWKDLTGTVRENKPWLNGLPRMIFVNDMGDTFTASLPVDWLAPELRIMAASPHNWILLTKRADRQREFSLRHTLPANVWAGVSITSPQDQRLRYLMQTRARIRWVSYEPMLAPVDWRPWLGGDGRVGLDWIIVGGASGPDYQSQMMNLTWLENTVKQCRDANVALFVKQDSSHRAGQQGRIPSELWVRQFPKIFRESHQKDSGLVQAR
jgi:protein gp37